MVQKFYAYYSLYDIVDIYVNILKDKENKGFLRLIHKFSQILIYRKDLT